MLQPEMRRGAMAAPSVDVVIDACQDGIPGTSGTPAVHWLAGLVRGNDTKRWLRPELAALAQDVAIMQAQLV